MRARVRVLYCATDLRILRGRESPSELVLEEPSSTTLATNLELNRTSLEFIILAKINAQFMSNCRGRKQIYKGRLFLKRNSM